MMNATSHHVSVANRQESGLYSLACVNVFKMSLSMEAEDGPSFCKRQKVGTSCKKLKEI
jgi:hypothetical protein